MSTTVRLANERDAEALAALMSAQLAEHERPQDPERLANAVQQVLKTPDLGFFIVAEQAGQILGAAYIFFMQSLEHGGRTAWLDEIYVTPHERNRGLGTLLLHAVCGEVKRRGCPAMELEVDVAHEGAAHLYERLGFQALQRRRYVRKL